MASQKATPTSTTPDLSGPRRNWARASGRVAVAFLIGGAGGMLFALLGVPLPWTLGSIAAAAVVAIAGGRWLMPGPIRDVARPVVGVLAGSAFMPSVIASLGVWWPVVVFVVFYGMVTTAVGYLVFRRLFRFDKSTAFFSALPAGLAEMSLLGGGYGGSMRTIVLIHTARIVTVVFAIPLMITLVIGREFGTSVVPNAAAEGVAVTPADWLILIACGVFGYIVGKRYRIPGGILIASILASALVHATGLTHAVPPGWLVALVQVVIGSVAGARFVGVQWVELRSTVLIGFGWAIVLVALALGTAYVSAAIFDREIEAMLLALAPGGMVEMTLITYALGIEVAFVVTCQVCRNIGTLMLAPPIFERIDRKAGKRPPAPGE